VKVRIWLPCITFLTLALNGCGQNIRSLEIGNIEAATQTVVASTEMESPLVSPSIVDGEKLFDESCASCHVKDEQNNFANISNEFLETSTPKQVFDVITNGIPEKDMPAFTQLSAGDRWDVTGYLYVHDLSETEKRSARLIYQNICLSCHGSEGQGDGSQAISSNLVMEDWQNSPLLANISDQDLFTVIRNGKGTNMRAYAVMLSEPQTVALTKIVRLLSIQEEMNFNPQIGLNQNNTVSGTDLDENQGFFTIEGNVINVSGGSVNTDSEAQLKVISNGQTIKEMSSPMLANGSFKFHVVPYAPDWIYVATVSHNGFTFSSNLIYGQDTTSAATTHLLVRVYDATSDTGVLMGEQTHVLLTFTDDNRVHVVEYVLISNHSSYVVSAENNQKPLLQFSIPTAAEGLIFSDSTESDYFQLIEGGFGDWQPIEPGSSHQVMFEYDLPFNGDDSFGFALPVNTTSMLIMVQDRTNEISCKGPLHLNQKTGTLGSLDIFSAINIPAGNQVSLHCFNKNQVFPQIIGIFSLLLVLVVIGTIYADRKKQEKRGASPEHQKTTLLDAIIVLDDQYKAGELSTEVYNARRDELIRQIEGEKK